jgi:cytidylate kinase
MIVAIDGPAATGKSTSAKLVAQKLGFTYMDTGAMYRCVTLSVLRGHISLTDEQAIKLLLKDVDIQIEMIEDTLIVRLNNEDVSMLIRKPKVTSHVSAVSALPRVREHMVTIQRQIGEIRIVSSKDEILEPLFFPMPNLNFFWSQMIL